MTAVGDARKRRQESVPADETVRVPAADILALAAKWDEERAELIRTGTVVNEPSRYAAQLRALVDAAERPDEGEPCCKCGSTPYPGTDAPMEDCPVHYPPPAPLSSPRRTRDEGITLTNEERADLTAELADYTIDVRVDPNTVARIALGPVIAANIVEAVLCFRAARLDELEHEVEGLAWRNQQLTERLEQYTMTDPIDLNARREQRVPEPDGEPAIVMPMDTDEIIFRDQAALDEYVAGAIRAARQEDA